MTATTSTTAPGVRDAAAHQRMNHHPHPHHHQQHPHQQQQQMGEEQGDAAASCGCGGGRDRSKDQQTGKPPALQRLRRRVSTVQQLWIYPFTHYKPTNQVMLCYRTLFQDLRSPGHNQDHLAARFRDDLMPSRRWVHNHAPALLRINKFIIGGPIFGCPGVMDYLDARTRWLDAEVERAIADGCTQVVVVAAGYDTRAYRFASPGKVTWFEIDLPSESASKQALVNRTLPAEQFPRPTYIAADLSQISIADALLGANTRCNNSSGVCSASAAAREHGTSSGGASDASSAAAASTAATSASAASGSTTPTRAPSSVTQSIAAASTSSLKDGGNAKGGGGIAGSAQGVGVGATRLGPSPSPSTVGGGGSGGGGGRRFDPSARTLFTVEGLVYYLEPEAVSALLRSIRSVAAPGSRVAFDFLHQDVFSGHRYAPGYETLRLTVANKGEPKRSGLDPATLPTYLMSRGWALSYMPKPRDVAAEMYPHRSWSRFNPPIPPFYNFAVAETA